jgi:hypothetical protein
VSDFSVGPGRHAVTIGGRFLHSRPLEFESDGDSAVEINFGPAPGWFMANLCAIGSNSIWRGVGALTGIGLWSQLLLIPTAVLYVYLLVYRRFGGDPVVWLATEVDPRIQARSIKKPLRGYPYSPEQLDPAVRAQYETDAELWQAQATEAKLRARRVRKPLRGYPYHPEQLDPGVS